MGEGEGEGGRERESHYPGQAATGPISESADHEFIIRVTIIRVTHSPSLRVYNRQYLVRACIIRTLTVMEADRTRILSDSDTE